jgi:hypothetical protein
LRAKKKKKKISILTPFNTTALPNTGNHRVRHGHEREAVEVIWKCISEKGIK